MARAQIYALPRSFLMTFATTFVALMLAVGASMLYTNYVDRNSNQAWCDIINSLDKRYQSLPTDAAPEAYEFAAQIRVLQQRYKCLTK
jgi:hypothetical protein